jgi:hypothetical protein
VIVRRSGLTINYPDPHTSARGSGMVQITLAGV